MIHALERGRGQIHNKLTSGTCSRLHDYTFWCKYRINPQRWLQVDPLRWWFFNRVTVSQQLKTFLVGFEKEIPLVFGASTTWLLEFVSLYLYGFFLFSLVVKKIHFNLDVVQIASTGKSRQGLIRSLASSSGTHDVLVYRRTSDNTWSDEFKGVSLEL